MKKSQCIIYAFYNFYFNYIVEGTGYFDKKCMKYMSNKTYSIENTINGLLVVMFYLCIYTLINLLIYKFVTRKHKLPKVYLLIPLGTMVLGITVNYSLMVFH